MLYICKTETNKKLEIMIEVVVGYILMRVCMKIDEVIKYEMKVKKNLENGKKLFIDDRPKYINV